MDDCAEKLVPGKLIQQISTFIGSAAKFSMRVGKKGDTAILVKNKEDFIK